VPSWKILSNASGIFRDGNADNHRFEKQKGTFSPLLPLSSIFVLFYRYVDILKNYIIILKYKKSKYANEKVGEQARKMSVKSCWK